MARLPWFKCNPQDLLDGLLDLDTEEQGPYMVVLSLIYIRGAPLPDDARWLAGNCKVSVRRWNVIRAALIAKGKLFVTADGRLMNARAAAEIGCSEDNPEITGGKTQDKPEAPEANVNKSRRLQALDKERELDKKPPKGGSRRKGDPLPVKQAFDEWNAMASRNGLPFAKQLDDARKASIRTRLSVAGLDGWREALSAVEASAFCRGENDRNWRADLDFVCQAKSFRRLREGAYADKVKPGQGPPTIDPAEAAALRTRLESLTGARHAPAC